LAVYFTFGLSIENRISMKINSSYHNLNNPDVFYGGNGNDYNGDGHIGGYDEFMGHTGTSGGGIYADRHRVRREYDFNNPSISWAISGPGKWVITNIKYHKAHYI
jgi:hypothetical protein